MTQTIFFSNALASQCFVENISFAVSFDMLSTTCTSHTFHHFPQQHITHFHNEQFPWTYLEEFNFLSPLIVCYLVIFSSMPFQFSKSKSQASFHHFWTTMFLYIDSINPSTKYMIFPSYFIQNHMSCPCYKIHWNILLRICHSIFYLYNLLFIFKV